MRGFDGARPIVVHADQPGDAHADARAVEADFAAKNPGFGERQTLETIVVGGVQQCALHADDPIPVLPHRQMPRCHRLGQRGEKGAAVNLFLVKLLLIEPPLETRVFQALLAVPEVQNLVTSVQRGNLIVIPADSFCDAAHSGGVLGIEAFDVPRDFARHLERLRAGQFDFIFKAVKVQLHIVQHSLF